MIFHSYVSLPEGNGNEWKSLDITPKIMPNQWDFDPEPRSRRFSLAELHEKSQQPQFHVQSVDGPNPYSYLLYTHSHTVIDSTTTFIYIYIHMYVCMYVCLYVCMSVCLSVCLFVCLFVRSFVRSFVRLFVCLFVCMMHACMHICNVMQCYVMLYYVMLCYVCNVM